MTCDWFWGSHGCDLPAGHDGNHLCGAGPGDPHSEHDGTRARSRYYDAADNPIEWGEWWTLGGSR